MRDYVAWLLKETPGWDRDHIDEVIRFRRARRREDRAAVPVYWVYVTAWGAPDGVTQFRDDIYQKDGIGGTPGQVALQGRPVAQNTSGGNKLLPRDDDETR